MINCFKLFTFNITTELFSRQIGHLGRFGQVVAMSMDICIYIYVYVPFSCQLFQGISLAPRLWQDQPGRSRLAGSTRQQTVGRINQVEDCGDGDKDEDKDKDEIPKYAVLLTASVKRFGVSRMWDFFKCEFYGVVVFTNSALWAKLV